MQRILSGFGITGRKAIFASGWRFALAAAPAASASAPAAIADFRFVFSSRRRHTRSATSSPSTRPHEAVLSISKLANFIRCPLTLEPAYQVDPSGTMAAGRWRGCDPCNDPSTILANRSVSDQCAPLSVQEVVQVTVLPWSHDLQ